MRIRIILPSFVLPLCLLGLLFGVRPMRSGASSQGQDQVTAAQLAAALEAQKQADAKLTRGESAERRFQELSARLQQTAGTTPVIVQLAVAFRPEGEIQTEAERLAQRAAIRQAQDDLLDSVFGGIPPSLKRYETIPYLAVPVNAAELAALQASPLVLDVQEDIAIPVAQAQAPSISLIGATNAWASGYTGAGKTIAILDTGVDKAHTALAGKVVSEACYSTNYSDFGISSLCPGGDMESVAVNSGLNCTEFGECAHGTSVAGIAAGNGSGFSGVAKDANLISIQVNSRVDDVDLCGGDAPCILTVTSDLVKGLERVYALRDIYSIASVNISLGDGMYTGNCDSGNPVKTAVDQLRSVGIATVVASGNGSYSNALGFPACVSTAVSVGATGDGVSLPAGEVMSVSNSAQLLNLLSPGYFPSAPIPGGSNNVSGTSVAAAHVSGAWAILKQQQPAASVSVILSRLANNGVNVMDSRNGISKPRIQIDAALSCLQNVPAYRWKGEYFDNTDLAGNPVMIQDDGGGSLDKNFGGGSPGSICGPGADNFSARWTRTINFTANLYRFSITADDGARFYVDGNLKLDFWNGPPGVNTIDVPLDGRDHVIKLEFREFGGAARASLSWTTPCFADVPVDSWKGEYFNNIDLAGSPVMVSNDGNGFIDWNWGSGSPSSACGINADNFSVRWTRRINFPAGMYTRFTVTGDDGVRLYIDGQLKLDRWNVTAGVNTIDVEMPAGNHDIKLEYREFGGLAIASLSWTTVPCPMDMNVPSDSWKGEYYNNINLGGSPVMVRNDGNGFIYFDWGGGGPSAGCGAGPDFFSARWTRNVYLPNGTGQLWNFRVTADNGVRLYVDGYLVIDRWTETVGTNTANLSLPEGWHAIKLEYFESWGAAAVSLSYSQCEDVVRYCDTVRRGNCYFSLCTHDLWCGGAVVATWQEETLDYCEEEGIMSQSKVASPTPTPAPSKVASPTPTPVPKKKRNN